MTWHPPGATVFDQCAWHFQNIAFYQRKRRRMLRSFLSLLAISLIGTAALANTSTCSNASGTLSYSHQTGNGGAPLDLTSLTYLGHTQRVFDPQRTGLPIDWSLGQTTVIDQQASGNAEVTTSYGLAAGRVQADGQNISFSEWVICAERVLPICHECP